MRTSQDGFLLFIDNFNNLIHQYMTKKCKISSHDNYIWALKKQTGNKSLKDDILKTESLWVLANTGIFISQEIGKMLTSTVMYNIM